MRRLRDEENITPIGHFHYIDDFTDTDFTLEFLELIENEYLNMENHYLPMGVEKCSPRPSPGDRYHGEKASAELLKMRRSYINRDYSRKILKVWEQQGYMHEVQRRLGYRFTLLKGTLNRQSAPGDEFFIDISLANNRFARLTILAVCCCCFATLMIQPNYGLSTCLMTPDSGWAAIRFNYITMQVCPMIFQKESMMFFFIIPTRWKGFLDIRIIRFTWPILIPGGLKPDTTDITIIFACRNLPMPPHFPVA